MSQLNNFSVTDAFSRNLGLISQSEQETLRDSLVVIPGCGGVGGFHAHTLARLGVGRFRIADPDEFSVCNFNRQIGANINTIDKNKAEVTADIIKSINPLASVKIFTGGFTPENAKQFVEGADLVMDGVDFFSMKARRLLFQVAWEKNIPAITCAPLGFSGTIHVFMQGGMSFDRYFQLNDQQEYFDQIINFFIGLAPGALHISYMDLSGVDPASGRGPSSVVGVQQAACLAGAAAIKILLKRKDIAIAPNYLQFDAYRQKLRKGKLRLGSRFLIQKIKRKIVIKKFMDLGLVDAFERLKHG